MFIVPMTGLGGLESVGSIRPAPENSGVLGESAANVPFKSVFQDAIKDVTETDRQVSTDVTKLVTGQSDDLHTLGIDIQKAQLSLNLMVQLRNKAMDAYSEVMRMNL